MKHIDRLICLFDSGKYSADKEGNVYSHTDTSSAVKNKIKKLNPYSVAGYLQVDLYDQKGKIKKRVHQVVWTYFNRTFDTSKVINHIDYNTHNNAISNLELVTQSDNLLHSKTRRDKNVPRGEKHQWAKLDEKKVKDIRYRLSQGEKHKEIAKIYGVFHKTIYLIGKRLRWAHV